MNKFLLDHIVFVFGFEHFPGIFLREPFFVVTARLSFTTKPHFVNDYSKIRRCYKITDGYKKKVNEL